MANPKYSFVVTIYNDGYLVAPFCAEFRRVFQAHLQKEDVAGDVELLFVNDGSKNDSLALLRAAAQEHAFVRVIDLSRNFGQHVAILCGYHHALGSFVGRLNVDMQDPPREIPKLLQVIENEDVDLVVGIQKERKSSFLDKLTARLFFRLFDWLTGQHVPQNTSTLRVMNRRFVDAFKMVDDKFPFLQGLETWFGFHHKYVEVEHQERKDGKSSYNFRKRLALAIDAAICFSDRPLRLSILGGSGLAGLAVVALLVMVARNLMFDVRVPGYASTVCVAAFFAGLQIAIMGVSGLYIGKILLQVQRRPTYLIRETINFTPQNFTPQNFTQNQELK